MHKTRAMSSYDRAEIQKLKTSDLNCKINLFSKKLQKWHISGYNLSIKRAKHIYEATQC